MKIAFVSLMFMSFNALADASFGESSEAVCRSQKEFYKQNCKTVGGTDTAPRYSDCGDGSTVIVAPAKPVLQPDVNCPQITKHCTVTEQKADGKAVKVDYVEIKGKVQKIKFVTDKNKVQKFYAYAAKGMLFCAKQDPKDEKLNYCELDSSTGRGSRVDFPYDVGSEEFCKFIAGETNVAKIPRLSAPSKDDAGDESAGSATTKNGQN